eukprot:jgi/Hompol1/6324/HPOL_001083-RA
MNVAAASNGGPIGQPVYRTSVLIDRDQTRATDNGILTPGLLAAFIRNDRRIITAQAPVVRSMMHIYSSSGRLISQFQWDKGRLIAMGWTSAEKLVCVLEYGMIRIYDLEGELVQINLGEDAKENGVLDARISENGVVVLTTNLKFISVPNLSEPRPILLANPGISQPPHSWIVVPASVSLSKHIEVLLSVEKTVIVADPKNAQDQMLQQGPFTRIALSPNGKFLALFTSDGRLWVVSSDFQTSLAEFRTNSSSPPIQIAWCGNDSVLLHWEDTILMVGPSGDWIKYAYDGVVHIVTEIDSARIITNTHCEILERVPGAILFDAREHYERKTPKADESIRSIRPQLMEAVISCIDAAGHEFDIQIQKALLRAATFGKAFLESFSAERFVEMCRTLRVLNAVRDPSIGIPVTFKQLMHIAHEGLVDKLIRRHEHLLAKHICEYLKMPVDRVLIDWACVKVKTATEDEEVICRVVVEKLAASPGISFSDVAKAAYALIDYEPSSANQVPLLLSMQQDELALIKAIESFDSDLVYLALLHLMHKMPAADFFQVVSTKPLACSLLESFCRQQDPQLLHKFYYQEDKRVLSANLIFQESFQEKDLSARILKIKGALKLYAEERATAFESKILEEQCKLLQYQATLERDLPGQSFIDLSLSQTVHKCLVIGQPSRAAKLRSDFKIEDRRYAYIELSAIIETENWELIEKFPKANPKFDFKSAIDMLVVAGHDFRAQLFVESLAKVVSNVALAELKQHLELALQNFGTKWSMGCDQGLLLSAHQYDAPYSSTRQYINTEV